MTKRFKQSLSDEVDLNQTAKYDNQRLTLATELTKLSQTGVFNPFESKINEHAEEFDGDQDSFDRE